MQCTMCTLVANDNDEDEDEENDNEYGNLTIRRSVRSCSHAIPEKVRNSRPINMGFKGWG